MEDHLKLISNQYKSLTSTPWVWGDIVQTTMASTVYFSTFVYAIYKGVILVCLSVKLIMSKCIWTWARKPLKGFTALYGLPNSDLFKLQWRGSFTCKYIVRYSADQLCLIHRHLAGSFSLSYFHAFTDFSPSLLRVLKRVLKHSSKKLGFCYCILTDSFALVIILACNLNILAWLL